MEVQEIKNIIENKFLVTHIEKGHTYIILNIIKSKHPDTGKWYDAVRYKQLKSKETFVRSIKSFCENFRIINNNNNNIKNINIMNEYIKNLINVNKEATKNIADLESSIQNVKINTDKTVAKYQYAINGQLNS